MTVTKLKPNPVQEKILKKMGDEKRLCSMLSIEAEKTMEYGASLRQENVMIGTVKALLRKGLIVEASRHLCSEGTVEGKPHQLWRITYQVAE